jgi:ribosomal protein S1
MSTKNSKIQKDEKLEKLFQKDLTYIPKKGDIIEGEIISASKSEIYLDINGLTVGVVRGRELYNELEEYSNLKTGDRVSAIVLELENERGEMELSFREAGQKKALDNLFDLLKKKETIEVKVIEANKGGLIVKIGSIAGFLPVSQLSPIHYPRVEGGNKTKILEKLKDLINQTLKVVIIDIQEKENKIIVSEKETDEIKNKIFNKFQIGDIVEGKVKEIMDFGIFVEFEEGLEGLVHISEIAWRRVDNLKNFVKIGGKVKVKILGIKNFRFALSIKKTTKNPWEEIIGKYNVGDIVKGKVLNFNPFGAFIELNKDIQGLLHLSEFNNSVKKASDVLKIGQVLDFKIISFNPKAYRLGFSLKGVEQDKKEATKEKEKNNLQ